MTEFIHRDREEADLATQDQEAGLLYEMQQLLDAPPEQEDRERLAVIVDDMFALLPLRFEFDDCEGYLHEVTEEFPNWDGQVQALFMEQALLYEQLRDIRGELHQAEDSMRMRTATLHWLKVWTECLLLHQAEERRLRQIAVNFDPGGQD